MADETKEADGVTRVTFSPDMTTATFSTPPPSGTATVAHADVPAPFDRTQKWFYPPVAEHTSLVQFMANGPAEVEVKWLGKVQRGEVKKLDDKRRTAVLVEGGLFSHVAADTPLGVPEALKLKAAKPASEGK